MITKPLLSAEPETEISSLRTLSDAGLVAVRVRLVRSVGSILRSAPATSQPQHTAGPAQLGPGASVRRQSVRYHPDNTDTPLTTDNTDALSSHY